MPITAAARARELTRCTECHREPRSYGSLCPECWRTNAWIYAAHSFGDRTPMTPQMDPGRQERIAKYTARAAAGLPLFD